MRINKSNSQRAGFLVRFTAAAIDMFLIWAAVEIIVRLFNNADIYVPFEFAFFVIFLVYSIVFIRSFGGTIGKTLCGAAVLTLMGKPIGFVRALLRETICKSISAVFVFLGFFWVGISRRKRGWHDYLAGTVVRQNRKFRGTAQFFSAVVLISILFISFRDLIPLAVRYAAASRISVKSNVTTAYSQRDPASLTEADTVDQSEMKEYVQWLDNNAVNAIDYAVKTSLEHQVTIFGEFHWVQDNLAFLNSIIPELYSRAGVTCIAMEACAAEDNGKLLKLVTSEKFDKALAMEIARSQGWQTWGWKGYWDVFETVWKLNSSLPEDSKKMRVVGIDFKWDGPSMAFLNIGELSVKGPVWEKLRMVRVLDDIILLSRRDEIMAGNVVKEIIEKQERGIVWIGGNHSFTGYRQPAVQNGKAARESGRMGFILHQKYGDEVFQILLHDAYKEWRNEVLQIIDRAAAERNNIPFGFDVSDSPFAKLRDSKSYYYRYQNGVCFSDLAGGYIFLKPFKEQKRCEWLDGYISGKMFIRNKPYYEAKAGRKLKNSQEANESFKEPAENSVP